MPAAATPNKPETIAMEAVIDAVRIAEASVVPTVLPYTTGKAGVMPGTMLFGWKLPDASTRPAWSHTVALVTVVGVSSAKEWFMEIPSALDGTNPALVIRPVTTN